MAAVRVPLAMMLVVAACCACGHSGTPSPPAPTSGSGVASSTAPRTTAPILSAGTADTPVPSSRAPRSAASTTASTAAAPTARIPPVSAAARSAGLVDVRTVVPDAVVDLRYATRDNFVGVRLYPPGARCLVHSSMAPGLVVAAQRLRRDGDVLVFWDCYRPHSVQVRMFQIVPDPNWVARPGPYATSHEAGRSVDVTLARAGTAACAPAAQVERHCLLDMGTGFDDFTPRAYAYATDGVSARAQTNRALLRDAMAAGGITVYAGEWWHFDGPGSKVARPHLDAPLS